MSTLEQQSFKKAKYFQTCATLVKSTKHIIILVSMTDFSKYVYIDYWLPSSCVCYMPRSGDAGEKPIFVHHGVRKDAVNHGDDENSQKWSYDNMMFEMHHFRVEKNQVF